MNSISNAIENTKALAMDVVDKSLRFSYNHHPHDGSESCSSSEDMIPSRRSFHSSSSSSLNSSSSSSYSAYYYSPQRESSIIAPKRFRSAMAKLALREEDLRNILDEEGGLDKLKKSLRKRGAVTDSLVKQGLYLYVMEQNNNKNRQEHSYYPK